MPQPHDPSRYTLGLLLEDLTDSRFAAVWRGAVAAARQRGAVLRCFCVGSLQDDDWMAANQQRILCRLIDDRQLDGLLTLQWWREKSWFEQICRPYRGLPIVNLMRHFEGYPGIRVDNREGVRCQLQHAIEVHGCRRIAYMPGVDSTSSRERFDAYQAILQQYGIPFDPALVVPRLNASVSEHAHARNGVNLLLHERNLQPGPDLDAIATFNDAMALGAIEELQRRGIAVPYDIAVVGFNNQDEADFSPIPLTTVAIPWRELGQQAVTMLIEWLDTDVAPGHRLIAPELVIRRSCGCHEPETRHAGLHRPAASLPALTGGPEALCAAMTDALTPLTPQPQPWMTALVTALWREAGLNDSPPDSPDEFLRIWEQGLHQMAERGLRLDVGHEVLSTLLREFRRISGLSPDHREQIDRLCQQGRIVLHKLALRTQRRLEAQHDQQDMIVREIGQRLITTFDLSGLMDVLAEELPRLHIGRCALALYANPQEPAGRANLLLAYHEQGRVSLPEAGQPFPAPMLLPAHLLPAAAEAYEVVEALFFGDRQLGFVVFGNGPRDGRLYRILRAEISSALQGALLIRELQQYREHLEELVDDRTTELRRSNEQLHQSIQERARAEEALRFSEQQYRMLAEHVKDGLLIVQHDQVVFGNAVLAAMLGVSPEALLGSHPTALLHADPPAAGAGAIQQANIATPDGRNVWVEIEATAILWNSRAASLLTVRNITARKLKEEQLEEERTRLHQENLTLRSTIKERFRFGDLIGKSAPMQQVYELIMSAAASDVNALVVGESGTGKELVARTLHRVSARRQQAFVAVNCASIPETLFEREFFGHRRGAFTGADRDKPGLFDRAHEGVLFLDEVTELTPGTQAKLLRVLQNGEYTPLGSAAPKQADVLIMAATNKHPHEEIAEKRLRADFFYRICVIEIKLPALRERTDDLPLLIEHFLEQYREKQARKGSGTSADIPSGQSMLPAELMQALYAYAWPGNIRELQNVLQRYLATRDLASVLALMSIPPRRAAGAVTLPAGDEHLPQDGQPLNDIIRDVERRVIADALARHEYNVEAAARQLALNPRTLYRKIKQYNLWKAKYR